MWKYSQLSGAKFDPEGKLIAHGYAGGNCGKNPEGRNNPNLDCVRQVGPLPRGMYTFGEPIDHPHLGKMAIPLIPDATNEMHGRSAFYEHGDNKTGTASEGCIIMPLWVRKLVIASSDKRLLVTE